MNAISPAVAALLAEYRKAIDELIAVIRPLDAARLTKVADPYSKDPDCRSVQSVLTHVVRSGYGYTVYMENHLGHDIQRPRRKTLGSAAAYEEQLNAMYDYCVRFFTEHPGIKIEELNNAKKITVRWNQQYDIEQLMEHAIVHILRHRRQIERFLQP